MLFLVSARFCLLEKDKKSDFLRNWENWSNRKSLWFCTNQSFNVRVLFPIILRCTRLQQKNVYMFVNIQSLYTQTSHTHTNTHTQQRTNKPHKTVFWDNNRYDGMSHIFLVASSRFKFTDFKMNFNKKDIIRSLWHIIY